MISTGRVGQVQCRLLGPFQVTCAGTPVAVGGATAQAVLVGLVQWPGTVITARQLVSAVWGSPDGASADSVYHYVSALRTALAGTGVRIESCRPGYRITLDPWQVDVVQFDELVAAARQLSSTDPDEAATRLHHALSLWRGPAALPGLTVPSVRRFATALDGRRLDAEEDLAELELARGNVGQLLDRLRQLQAAHPERRRLDVLLGRALQLTGRTIPPGNQVSDPHIGRRSTAPAAPFQLPPDTPHFTGREAEVERLVSRWAAGESQSPQTVVVTAVVGMGGVGKTALVVHAAHQIARHFPDGVLFADLRGFTPDAEPTPPQAVLDALLRGLGVRGAEIPPGLGARTALYRSVLAGRRVLVVLDNVANADQVRPLLPGAPGCLVLVSSRRRLAGLDDAELVTLDTLAPTDAITLFTRVAADRAAGAGPQTLDELVRLCGYLPLAIRILAARLRTSRSATPARLVTELRAENGRLAALDDGERTITSTLGVSFRYLSASQQLALRHVALHPGTDGDLRTAAALLDADITSTSRTLAGLEDASLLDQRAPDRFALHDLTREFAIRLGADIGTPVDQQAALARLFDHYLHTAAAANLIVMPHRLPVPLDGRAREQVMFDEREDALRWFDAERQNLLAVCRLDDPVFDQRRAQLAYYLRDYFFLRKHVDMWVETHRLALVGCQRSGDLPAEARTHNNLGRALLEAGDLAGADAHYDRARLLFDELGDHHGLSNALANQATVLRAHGRYGQAVHNQQVALDYYRRNGATRNIGITLRSMARTEAERGRLTEAAQYAEGAVEIAVQQDLDLDVAQALNVLGAIRHRAGDDTAATAAHLHAIELSRACGSDHEQARALHHLGWIAARSGDHSLARRRWTEALALFDSPTGPQAHAIRADLTALDSGPQQAETGPLEV